MFGTTETYRGRLEVQHEPDSHIAAGYRDYWFTVYEPDSTTWLFRVRMRVHWEYAIRTLPPGTDPLDGCRLLARDLGIRWVHGLVDLARFERGKVDEQDRTADWDPEANDDTFRDDDIRLELLRALQAMNRDQVSSGDILELDVRGVSDVLQIGLERVRGILSEMLLEGFIAAPYATYGRGAEDGECQITGEGLRELRRLEGRRSMPSQAVVKPADPAYDVFICHATEDKGSFVRPLATALSERSLRVWYDEFELHIGDSLRRKIDHGIATSSFGVVVLSKEFFSKNWPRYELDGLVTLEVAGRSLILPIWHNVSKDQVATYSPSLADKVARSTAESSIDEIADEIALVVRPSA